MTETPSLSESAIALLRGYRGDIAVGDSNREACRELEAEGLVVLSRPFVGEPSYRLTKLGWKLAEVLERISAPSPAGSASPRP